VAATGVIAFTAAQNSFSPTGASGLKRVLCSIKIFTNEIDGFVRQARRKPEQYRVVLRAFATQHDGQRRDFM
jgi:hypothetical protein